MAALLSYLPPFEGLLPKWLFLVTTPICLHYTPVPRTDPMLT